MVIDNLSLNVPAGSVFGFLGQNGAGKTTTIRLLLGLLRPTSGAVRLFGKDVASDRMQAVRGVGALVETPSLYDRLTGRENLQVTQHLLGAPSTELDRVLELVDMKSAESKLVGGYSLGMRQRLGVARALIGNPRLLVLDEPSNGLDPDGIRDMRHLIQELPKKSDVTVFVSSHLLAEVEQIATHVALIHRGRLRFQAELGDLIRRAGRKLDVGVPRATLAAEKLREVGFNARDTDPSTVEVFLPPDEPETSSAARINACLMRAGFAVFRLNPRQSRLEEIYLGSVGRRAEAGQELGEAP
ncbi:MAG TPA: ATP-binding cassette domain-containing protein [Chloroflexota bacterium]|nr:ATP-binding cassette domain-containing protein [Chloroflexota bacterium]